MLARVASTSQSCCAKKTMSTRLRLSLYILLFALRLSCGSTDNGQGDVQNPIVYEKIVEGKKARPGRFPYMCSLRKRGSRTHVCGGTLFRADWVLTAAHCLDNRVTGSTGLSPVVYCGIHKLDEIDPDKVFDAIAGYLHEDWTGDVTDGNDIALLKLDRKAKHLTLPRLGTGKVVITSGDYMTATGWGMTESAYVAKALRVTDRLAIVAQRYCQVPPKVKDESSWICAGGLGEDTCKGDSGGPLLLADAPNGDLDSGKPKFDMIVGITSYGYADDEFGQCSGFEPAIYTSVDYFLDWIETTIKSQSKRRSKAERRKLTRKGKQYETLSPDEMLTKMISAIRVDDALDAKALLLAGLDVNSIYDESVTVKGYSMETGSTLLHWAAAYDALKCTKALIERGARTEAAASNGRTPLHAAAFLGYIDIIEVLLDAGADVNAPQKDRRTPIHHAAVNGHAEALTVLLENGADIHKREWNLLYDTVRLGKLECVKILVDAGINVNMANSDRWTALHEAALRGHASIAKVLLESGARVDAAQSGGRTPLMYAVPHGYVDVVEVLLEYKADVNASSNDGYTALHAASSNGHVEIAKILLDHGASKMMKDGTGKTPLEVICLSTSGCTQETRAALEDLLKP